MSKYQIVRVDGRYQGLRDGQTLVVGDGHMSRCKASLSRIIKNENPMSGRIKWTHLPEGSVKIEGFPVIQQTEVGK